MLFKRDSLSACRRSSLRLRRSLTANAGRYAAQAISDLTLAKIEMTRKGYFMSIFLKRGEEIRSSAKELVPHGGNAYILKESTLED